MSIVEEIKSLSFEHLSVYTLVFMAFFAPGLLLIFQYKPILFETLASVKLIIFAISLSIPVPVINAIVMAIMPFTQKEKLGTRELVLTGTLLSSIVMYFALIVTHFFEFNFNQFCLIVLGVDFVFWLILTKLMESSPTNK